MKKSLLLLFSTYSLCLLSACGSGAGGPTSFAATHLSVAASPTATAGAAFNFTVTVLDASNGVATGYSGIVHFSSTDVPALLPANSTLTNGTGTFSATLKTIGSQTITATDTVKASITGTSTSISVSTNAATHFFVNAPTTAPAGKPITLTVIAQDASNNEATGYTGSVHFSSTDVPALLPTNSTLTNGTGTFSATLKTLGNQTISATDTVTPAITGTSNAINVILPAPLTITSGQPPNGTVGEVYNLSSGFKLTASGGQPGTQPTGGYTWSGSSLPPGLQISKICGPPPDPHGCEWMIDGTPTAAGTYKNVVITVTDFATPPAHTSATYTITISAAAAANPAALKSPDLRNQHHHYKLIDLGTLGGPNSYNESIPPEKIINLQGAAAAYADSATPDPYVPNCFTFLLDDCVVDHAFVWQHGVVTDLGSLPGGFSSYASSINDHGEIVGYSQNGLIDPLTLYPEGTAVLWKNGIINLGALGGNQSVANAVNDRGQVVGAALNAILDPFANSPLPCNGCGPFGAYFLFVPTATETHAFLWHGGKMQDLGTLGGPDSTAVVVNDSGEIAGQSFINFSANPSGVPTVDPFFWENGEMVDIGTLGGTFGFANWMNNRGQVVGTSNLAGDLAHHAFLWDKEQGLKDLGTLEGYSTASIAYWINDAGEIVGESDSLNASGTLTASRPVLWKDGVMTDLGTVAGDTCSAALSINSRGQIVGFGSADCDHEDHGFLSENGGPIIDLNALVIADSDVALIEAIFVNDRGEIAGRGKLANGDEHALVLIPCDENHPDVEGCDYDTVEVVTESQIGPALIIQAPSASPTNLSPAEMMTRFQSLRAGRHRGYGTPQALPH
jgi:probable HAF family extracellular repeat protein